MNDEPSDVQGSLSRAPRVIIADDHEWIRNILVDVVRQTLPHADVAVTEDGVQALEAFYDKGADFLVTNHAMPRLDGMGLIERVRQKMPHLPILMVSAHPEARADAVAAGADWFLSKNQIMEEMPPILLQYARVGRR